MITSSMLPHSLSPGVELTLSVSDTLASGVELPDSFDFLFSATDAAGLTSATATASVTCSSFSCPQGQYYVAGAGGLTGSCVKCPAGTAEEAEGMRSSCTPCAKGMYFPAEEGTTCIKCPSNTVRRCL